MTGAICGGFDWQERRVSKCWTEGRCGDSWQDGERGYRPFARGWRTEAIRRATQRWNAVPADWRALRRAAFESLREDAA